MVREPKLYQRVWAFNLKYIAVEYEIISIHNGTLQLRNKHRQRTLSKHDVFASLDELCEDVKLYASPYE